MYSNDKDSLFIRLMYKGKEPRLWAQMLLMAVVIMGASLLINITHWYASEPERKYERDMCAKYYPYEPTDRCLWEHRNQKCIVP